MNRVYVKEDIIYNNRIKKDIIICHISDIHFNTNTKKKDFAKLAKAIYKMKPDYIMITGDLIDNAEIIKNSNKIRELVSFISEISHEYKIFICIGNHDVVTKNDYRFFEKLNDLYNVYVLDNKSYQDDNIFVSGFTLPSDYYYNMERKENAEILVNYLDSSKELVKNLSNNKVKIGLIHSPVRLTDTQVLNRLNNYDLILTGHTHNGMVPRCLEFMFKGNSGIVAPIKGMFPKIARGRIDKTIDKHDITIIINGAYTKMSKHTAKAFSFLNVLFDKSVNKIIIKKRGIKYEN